MNDLLINLRRIRGSLALFSVLVVLGAVSVWLAQRYVTTAQAAYRQAQTQRNEMQGKLMRARDEEREIRERLARYEWIVQRGFIGEEHRLDWVEQIRAIQHTRRLLDVRYEVAPQHVSERLADNRYELMTSTMKLSMQLLHEDDLLNFLADLSAHAHAYVAVRRCSLERLSAVGPDRNTLARLKAECTLDWITLREKT